MTAPKQRVNISYSVNIEEIPNIILDLISEAVSRLEEASEDLTSEHAEIRMQTKDYKNYSYGIQSIDALRIALADIDYRLADCSSMLQGLENMKSAPPPADAENTPPSNDAIDALKKAVNAAAAASQAPVAQVETEHE